MISKLITGNGFGGAVRYSTKYGKDPDGTLHRLLAVSGVTFDYDENGKLTINPRKVGWDFRQQAQGYHPDTKNYRPIQKPVYHWILSWKEGEREIPPKEMLEVAKEFMRRIGFTNTQYVISAHYDKENQHLHIVANIVNNEGKRIVTQGLVEKGHKVAADMTRERGYEWGVPATKKTVESAKKPHEKVRYIIKPIIFEARRTSLTEDELVAKLKKSNINTIIRHAEDGKRGGVSFAYTYRGVEHTFRGSSVDRKLSYENIVKQLEKNRTQVEKSLPKEKILKLYPAAIEVGKFVTDSYKRYGSMNVDGQRRQEINNTITHNYSQLRKYYSTLRELNHDEQMDADEMRSLRIAGVILMNTIPVLGFALVLMSYIMAWVYKTESIEKKRRLLEIIKLAKTTIFDYKAIREELDRNLGMKTVLEYNNIDMTDLDVYKIDQVIQTVEEKTRPYKDEIRQADEKEVLARMPLPDVILVTRENYDTVRVPDEFKPYRSGQNIIVRSWVVPEEGLVVFKLKGRYGILPRKDYEEYQEDLERIKATQERYKKLTGVSSNTNKKPNGPKFG